MSDDGPYVVQYDPRALKELAKLDRPIARRIVMAVDRLGVQPRPPGGRALMGYPGLWRNRIGDYRVVYAISDSRRRPRECRVGSGDRDEACR